MNAPLTRRSLLGATATLGAVVAAGASAVATPVVADVGLLSPIIHPVPDAALILLAGRVESLAGRLWRLDGRLSTLEDRVSTARRRRPPLPPEPPLDMVIEHHDTGTERVMVVREPLVVSPAREAWNRARNAAKSDAECRGAALAERIGLPALERRRDRMRRRLDRWTRQLAATEAATASGLSAKARAFMALGCGCRFSMETAMQEHQALAVSILSAVSAETWGQA